MIRSHAAHSWCILRTSGSRTLALAKSLLSAGFEVWTPTYVEIKSARGSKRQTRTAQPIEREIAIMPSFLFARDVHVAELVKVRSLPVSPHPPFSFLQTEQGVALIADSQVEGLRDAEQRSRIKSRRSKRRALVMGQRVRFDQGAFAGIGGEIVKVRGNSVRVEFDGGLAVEIASWLLPENIVLNDASDLDKVA